MAIKYDKDTIYKIKMTLLQCENGFDQTTYQKMNKLLSVLEQNLCLSEEDYYQFISLLAQHKVPDYFEVKSEPQSQEEEWDDSKRDEQEEVKKVIDRNNHLHRNNLLVSMQIRDIRHYLKQGEGLKELVSIHRRMR